MKPLLFCATDAGGARNLAPVARLAGSRAIVLASDVTAPLFAEYGVTSTTLRIGGAGAAAVIEADRPRAVICGTSRFVGAERRLIAAAQAQRIPSVVVLDEWFDYRMRFADEAGKLAFLSDLICCPDRMARDEAAAEGLPESRLAITGSPSLSYLADRVAEFASAPPAWPDGWRTEGAGVRILFVSETHALDYGTGPARPGPLGPWLGYTEQDVRASLARVIAASGLDCTVVEKLHPSTAEIPAAPNGGPAWQTITTAPLWPLLWDADAVVGMKSMALVEAALMGHRPLSFQPNLQGADRCTAARLGLADRAATEGELVAWLRRRPRRGVPQRPAFADGDAANNVMQAILRLTPDAAQAPLPAST